MTEAAQRRATAAKVAKWLLDKGRPDDAVQLLAAWAAMGPNDPEGQNLLAEAFRIDPSHAVAKLAFERMEGIAGDHATLDAAIVKFGDGELTKLEGEMKRPNFRRAQVGFNNNVKYKANVYHIQTEDSGLDKPHIITHCFADGGRIIKSHKRSYASEVNRDDVATHVRALMKGQQMEMAIFLREGSFDEIIAGRAVGGMTTLENPPRAEVQKLATKKEDTVTVQKEKTTPPPAPAPRPSVADARIRFRMNVLRSLTGGPDSYAVNVDEAIIGADGMVALPGERFCHRREAVVRAKDGRIWLEDFEAGNGVFLRIRSHVELGVGDEFIVGDQLLRVERNPTPNDGPDPGPTYFYSSPKWISSFRVVQVFEGGARGACVVAHGTTLQIGSAVGDLVFGNDPLVSEQHCLVEEQAGVIVLVDLDSRTGVFVRIKGLQELVHGDELLVGRTRLVLDLSNPNP
jgi:pSer/pThr/pTyr-binding forkhead associated (FHA) protein